RTLPSCPTRRSSDLDLTDLVDDGDLDGDVKEQAVFALSQQPHDAGVPALIRIARTHPEPGVRRKALFWLGQSGDPRALALFEERSEEHTSELQSRVD